MKALIQRASKGKVTVEGKIVGEIGRGFVVLVGVKNGDTEENARFLAHKTVNLRIFPDQDDKMNLSIQDISGQILAVSQFTLYADTRKGNRPGFSEAAPPEMAEALYSVYVDSLRRALGEARVATGTFRASMIVELINDGPVTIELCTDEK
jgi:D-aminoacyl-tRNA deacylase